MYQNCESYFRKPAVDILETEKEVVLKAEMPGVRKENIDLEIAEGELRITAKAPEGTSENSNYVLEERLPANYFRSFSISSEIDHEKVAASYENGILKLTLPKHEQSQAKKIMIN